MESNNERREQSRVEIIWPITVFTDKGMIEGETVNITLDGIHIRCDDPLPMDNTFRMSILPPHHQAIGVTVKVIWSDLYGLDDSEGTYGVGMCLVEISGEDRRFLDTLVMVPS